MAAGKPLPLSAQKKTLHRFALEAVAPNNRSLVYKVVITCCILLAALSCSFHLLCTVWTTTMGAAAALGFSSKITIDVISIGSVMKATYQDAQEKSFSIQPSIRNLFRVNELSDSNRDCFTSLTMDEIQTVMDFCDDTEGLSETAKILRGHLFRPRKHTDWMCAQKRPIDALYHALDEYRKGMKIPSYLAIIPDDSFVNAVSLTRVLRNQFPPDKPNVIAGCKLEFLKSYNITFPHWGYGSFISKASIQRLLSPIHCNKGNPGSTQGQAAENFVTLACWRLSQNAIGEHQFFKEGMSIAELIFRFSSLQKFGDAAGWNAGFCMSAENALAYFFQNYHIAVPDDVLRQNVELSDKYSNEYGYQALTQHGKWDMKGECTNEGDRCSEKSIVCHKTKPELMLDITANSRKKAWL